MDYNFQTLLLNIITMLLESFHELSHETVYTTLGRSTSTFTNYKISNTLEYSSMAPTTLTLNHYQTSSGNNNFYSVLLLFNVIISFLKFFKTVASIVHL